MSEKDKPGLRRMDADFLLSHGLGDLTPEEAKRVREKQLDNLVDLERDLAERRIKSSNAENDMAVSIDVIRRLDQERKVYSKSVEGETGSGTYSLKIKGGDTKFIVSILLVVGVIIVAVVLVFALK